MHYWREQYFELLKYAAASALSEAADWQDYADFCLRSEQGLRRQAFVILEKFISRMEQEGFPERRRFVSWLMKLADGQRDGYMIVPYPLKVRLIEPTLAEWVIVEPSSSEPHCWIGSREHLESALKLDSTDQIALRRYICIVLGSIDYATHELPAGYLGSALEDLADLGKIQVLLPSLENEEKRADYAVSIAEERLNIQKYLQRRNQT